MKRTFRVPALCLLMVFMISLMTACAPAASDTRGTPSSGTLTKQRSSAASTSGKGTTGPLTTMPVDTDGDGREPATLAEIAVEEDGKYSSKMEVAAYLHQFGKLPSNYVTKDEARRSGWVAERGNLWEVLEGMSIGGDRFGNFERLLPEVPGRQYYECDIDYNGGRRGPRRIVYSNDGLIFYTDDHYASFERLE